MHARPGQACCGAQCADALSGHARSAQQREKLKQLLVTAAEAAAAAAAALDDAGAAAPGTLRCPAVRVLAHIHSWAQAIRLKQHRSTRDGSPKQTGETTCTCA